MENNGTHFYARNEWVISKVEATLKYIREARVNEEKRVVKDKLTELNEPLNWFQKLYTKPTVFTESEAKEFLEKELLDADWVFESPLYRARSAFDSLESLCYKLLKAAKVSSDGGIYLSIDDMDRLV